MKREIRLLENSDYEALLGLWRRCGLPHSPRGRDSREQMSALFRNRTACTLGLFLDGRMIGSIMGTSDGRKGWINRLAVDPAHRGAGDGLELIRACEGRLRSQGIQVISCLINEANEASRALFERAGYAHWPGVLYFSKRESMED